MKALVSGASGFICGYLVQELLNHGYEVVGLDNFSKYGRVSKSYDRHPHYTFVEGDAKDAELMKGLIEDCDHFVAAAAMIGGISYFHEFAYDLLAENERIIAAAFDAAIWAHNERSLRKITVRSSSTPPSFPPPRARSGGVRLQVLPTGFRSWLQSSSPRALISSTGCRTRLSGRLTALALASSERCATMISGVATLSSLCHTSCQTWCRKS